MNLQEKSEHRMIRKHNLRVAVRFSVVIFDSALKKRETSSRMRWKCGGERWAACRRLILTLTTIIIGQVESIQSDYTNDTLPRRLGSR